MDDLPEETRENEESMNSEDVADVLADIQMTDTAWATLLCVHPSQVSRWRKGRAAVRRGSAAGKVLEMLHERIRAGADTARLGRSIQCMLTSSGWARAVCHACGTQYRVS